MINQAPTKELKKCRGAIIAPSVSATLWHYESWVSPSTSTSPIKGKELFNLFIYFSLAPLWEGSGASVTINFVI